MKRRRLLHAAALCAALGTMPAMAQDVFPAKPIELVVPFNVGGSTDIVARALAKVVAEDLGESVVVINKGGAGGAIALNYVKRAAPDGYTLALFTAAGAAVTPHLQKVGYEPLEDFSPIMNFGGYTTYLTVAGDSPFKSFKDLTDYIGKHPDELSVAISTVGAVNHLGAARLMSERKLDVAFVPFGSGGQIINALLGGHVKVASVSGEIAPMVQAGKLRALVSFTREQLPGMENVPSIQQNGSDWELDSWLGIAAPAGLPEPIRQRLEAGFMKAARDPEFLKSMNDMAMIVDVGNGASLMKKLQTSYADNGKVIRDLGLSQQ